MEIFPTKAATDVAVDLLVDRYNISMQMLTDLLGHAQREHANELLHYLEGPKLNRKDIARLLIQREGPGLFGGSTQQVRSLRKRLLEQLSEDQIAALFKRHPDGGTTKSLSRIPGHLAGIKWHPGGPWPRDFVTALGFPLIFAGVVQRDVNPTVEDIAPLAIPPKLVEFQLNLKKRMLGVLEREGDKTRCMVTLPTGGGKTRVAVEAFIDWLHPRFAEGEYMLWIAQSEELCEQAVLCIKQMWASREFVGKLRLYRYYGARDLDLSDLRGGAVVASINQLHSRAKSNDPALDTILHNTGAMIIDEAHRAVSSMYDGLLRRAETVRGHDLFPLCGLTATPGRTGLNALGETVDLVDRFQAYLIKPDLGPDYVSDPLKYFRERGYLARAHHIIYLSGREYELNEAELEEMRKGNGTDNDKDLAPGFLRRLANDNERNLFIVKTLINLPRHAPTLVYACSVEHANYLAMILTHKGCRSGAIDADTSLTLRRGLIKEFKDGELDFLFNFGVLTTGFDAPKTTRIVICRPTTSEILYEQIVGRGLRGPKFGGTDDCDIIDFADNIYRLGPPLAYARFEPFWTDERRE
jgi:DNA repair protein RadD